MNIEVKGAIHGPSQDAIKSFESYCRNNLPDDFVSFIAYGNGGKPANNVFISDGSVRVIERFLPLMDEPETDPIQGQYDMSVVETQIGERLASDPDQLGCTLIPFAALFGGDFLCFDYRNSPSDPSVSIWDHNVSDDFSPATTPAAGSFSELISLLRLL